MFKQQLTQVLNISTCSTQQKQQKPINNSLHKQPSKHTLHSYLSKKNSHCKQTQANKNIAQCVRRYYFSLFSRIQYIFTTTYDSIYLGINIYDKYAQAIGTYKLQPIEIQACLMLALKYQQIYPPTFHQLSKFFKTNETLNQYILVQKKILKVLNFNILIYGVTRELENFSYMLEASVQVLHHFRYMLEIAHAQQHICKQFSWNIILKAIKNLFSPENKQDTASDQLENQQKSDILKCMKRFIHAKTYSHNFYPAIYTKYSKQKYNYCSKKPFPILNVCGTKEKPGIIQISE